MNAFFRRGSRRDAGSVLRALGAIDEPPESPLRAELYSADQMEEHGRTLAASHRIDATRAPDLLLARLSENEQLLVATCAQLTTTIRDGHRITPAGEWLLDNFYLIEEQIRLAKRHLPKSYSRELPRLGQGPSARRPRIYDLALETISHADGRVDTGSLSRFIAAYQVVAPLSIGELWGIPIMLRLALIENLRRVASQIAAATRERDIAERWAERMTDIADRDPNNLILVVADMARSDPPMVSAFVAELARRLQGQAPSLALALSWIEHRLAENGRSIEQMVQIETQKQAADQVTISNSIGSLRGLSAIDWREFVEALSLVEQKLREDPAGVYDRMDFTTRDRYRHAVEGIARHSRLSETDVARKAVQLAHDGVVGADGDGRARHVGYYLVGRGRRRLEESTDSSLPLTEHVRRFARGTPLFLYLSAIVTLTALSTFALTRLAVLDGWHGPSLIALMILVALGTSQLALSLVNWLSTLVVAPDPIPRMDYSAGIPTEARTLVVVPTMLGSAADVDALVDALEVRFLANRDRSLHFALLTDFHDGPEETMPGDDVLVDRAASAIDALNQKYCRDRGAGQDIEDDAFFLFHRPRRFNAFEGQWMGWERKRGKLEELNLTLRGSGSDRFLRIAGDTAVLSNVRYVITLDTDTQLPHEAAHQLVGAMAHPLNRARFDAASQRVVEGYGILQPRVAIAPSRSGHSTYARLSASEPGIDPYTRVVSDVYQDLFGEGSFIGKGIYDVDAFQRALADRMPENRILSHDLIEGCHARSGLISDVQLYEDTPARYLADVGRRHRWTRGDLQIAQWALPRLIGKSRGSRRNPLSALSRWKVADNLRRVLVAPAITALLVLGWVGPPHAQARPAWTLAILAIMLLPACFTLVLELLDNTREARFLTHLRLTWRSARMQLANALLMAVMLPFEAWSSLDAMLRTAWRMLVSQRRLLEWSTARDAERQAASNSGLGRTYRAMWFGPAFAIGVIAAMAMKPVTPGVALVASPLLLLWLLCPAIAWWISRPAVRRAPELSTQQLAFLHATARKTWMFFETFVGPADNWLPPDNYQEHPAGVVAHRTSPTNLGLSLLANLAAHDFGYITGGVLVERTKNALDAMARLARYRGHFLNWYDTQTLEPLLPRYVSSVDSGNLAGHLLVLRAGLATLAGERIVDARIFEGMTDTLRVLATVPGAPGTVLLTPLSREIESAYDSRPTTVEAMTRWLYRIRKSALGLHGDHGETALQPADAPPAAARRWIDALVRQCDDALLELDTFASWHMTHEVPGRTVDRGSTAGPVGTPPSLPSLSTIATLRELATLDADEGTTLSDGEVAATPDGVAAAAVEARAAIERAAINARQRLATIDALLARIDEMAVMEYDFLYDRGRNLFSIGYNVSDRRRDASYYDLLASEARLVSFVAIAQGQLPQDTWFALSRLLTQTGGEPVLVSWSGSMFEYLMPLLVMPTYDDTLLDETYHAAVRRQIAYGAERGVPWGVSESGYNVVDASLNYQYRAFGVPGLGLQRGLGDDLVIAPYASVLALMVEPEAACANLERLSAQGLWGPYGFYEAVDYTATRLPRGQTSVVIRSFMAHHQGMSLLSLAYLLRGQPMQRRFVADPQFRATLLLLQERVPKVAEFFEQPATLADIQGTSVSAAMPMRVLNTADTPSPEVQLLSNGRYHVMISNAGGGYSRWRDLAVTRWREDGTCDNWGTFLYIRDVASGATWSAAQLPVPRRPVRFEAIFSEGRAEFRRRDVITNSGAGIEFDTHTEIVVSPEDDIELRRVHLTNRSRTRRTIEVTSYAEVVLAPQASDIAHPAFSNLFVQTEIVGHRHAILCTRRARSPEETPPWLLHQVVVRGAASESAVVSYETDRARFIGRGRDAASAQALAGTTSLTGSEGPVLDPIVAIRHRVTIEAEHTVVFDLVLGVSETRDGAMGLLDKHHDRHLADRVFDLASTHGAVLLQQINASETDAQLFGRLAGSVIYANGAMRAAAAILARNRRGQSGLWSYAISGDLPIVLVQIGDTENIQLVRQTVQAHAYWRLKGLAVDLVIWNEDRAGYRQLLQEQIMGLIAAGVEAQVMDRPGGIFVRRAEQIADEDRVLLQSVARIIVSDRRGTLVEQANRRPGDARIAQLAGMKLQVARPRPPRAEGASGAGASITRELVSFNGTGGFSADGREYVIVLGPGRTTPAPWVNVIANPGFGTVMSESGMAYTWSENAHQFRLTPWNNDPVCDANGEAFFVRDEESGAFWSPTALPVRGSGIYVARHGFGYSAFEHTEDEIATELVVYVDIETPVKYAVLRVRNESTRSRKLSATGYVEWVLGESRTGSLMHVMTELDPGSGALCARNAYNTEFPERVAFFDVDEISRMEKLSFTCDRGEFLGRNGSLKNPASMARTQLSNRIGAAMDPCGALQVAFELQPSQTREIVFRLGVGGDGETARRLMHRARGSASAKTALERVRKYWERTLEAVQIDTGDRATDILANGWLIYQVLACRYWARSGFYQSGGAYGFRDQLQDAMALLHTEPLLLRAHLLRSAGHQFREGDVQHWWHPPGMRGVRTRCSDDYLWLPLATARYVEATGDTGVLQEPASWLEGRTLGPGEESYYDLPVRTERRGSLYEHCMAAIDRALSLFGDRGLPLIGSGDWNDGMNLVGIHGKGESVWLAFFLYDVLVRFVRVARLHGDQASVERCQSEAVQLKRNIELHAWDGQWYRRAWFDDGTPLGSNVNDECTIDAIAQSWSVLSGAGDPQRAKAAMAAVEQRLVRRDDGLIQLLTPPFDKSSLNPGYIRGYVPGVRENGGQYTHAAVWTTMAYAALGESALAWELMRIINPLSHADTEEGVARYRVEPYVVAADVYAASPHTGRGGWSWYTGSAGWMYRLIIESLLGVKLEIDKLRFTPCLSPSMPRFAISYRYRDTTFRITVLLDETVASTRIVLDGVAHDGDALRLTDDRQPHEAEVRIRPRGNPPPRPAKERFGAFH